MLDKLLKYIHGYAAIPVIISCRGKGLFSLLGEGAPLTLQVTTVIPKNLLQLYQANIENWLSDENNVFDINDWLEEIQFNWHVDDELFIDFLKGVST